MTIKEVEQALGIPRATVRFYEKEELIEPKRSGNSYREYSEEDVATLKKIIILRKIGMPVSDIKAFLNEDVPLQELLAKNILALQEQMRELEGAIRVSEKMQSKNEDLKSFDEEYYWEEIHTEEKAGNKFLELVNDVVDFEKKLFLKEFDLVDYEGNLRFDLKESILRVLSTCLVIGIVWFIIDGKEEGIGAFLYGFTWPFVCILVYTIFGLPLHFIGKKHPKAAELIKKIAIRICIGITVVLGLWIIVMAILGKVDLS